MSNASQSLPLATVAHLLPHRARLRLPGQRGDAAFFDSLADTLKAWPAVTRVHADFRTGSLLIEHDGDLRAILERAREAGLFAIDAAPVRSFPPPRRPGRRGVAPRPLSLAAAAFAGAGLYSASQGRVLSSGVEHLWQGFNVHRMLKRPWISATFVGLGLLQMSRGETLGSAASLFFYAASAWHMARGKQGAEETADPARVARRRAQGT